MQKANDNQQQHNPTTEISDYSTSNLVFNEAPYTSIVTSHEVLNYTDIIKVLSQVELPSPSPVLATSCTLNREHNLISFHDGQSSGTKIVDEIKENVELEKQLENEHENLQERGTQFLVPQTLSTERKRRSRIHERIRALKELVPNCNKKDQASILDDAIKYIESLQTQLQLNQMMQHMGAGAMPQDFYMSPENQQRLQGPYLAPFFTMRPMIGGGYSTGHYGYYVTSSFPTFPPFINGLNPLVPPPTEVDTGLLPVIPHGEFPSRMSEPVNSTTMSSGIIVPTTGSQVEYVISSQSSDHMPVRVR